MSDGINLVFDTRHIFQQIDIECLTPEELEILRPNLKKIEIFTKLIKVTMTKTDFCFVYSLSVLRDS
jgi:hypothetical protein